MGGSLSETADILRRARKRIEDPERWTQRYVARTKQRGKGVSADSPEATCWCATGAVMVEADAGALGSMRITALLDRAAEEMGFKENANADEFPAARLNDRGSRAHAHPRVLVMYDRAIELAEAEAK